jgi:hypothetical protein
MEAASLRLQKEAKGYLDSLRGNTPGLIRSAADPVLTPLRSHDSIANAHSGDD